MPTFSNLNDLNKWVSQHAVNIPLTNGKTIKSIFQGEAERLRKMIIKHISIYYSSYNPNVYDRTMGLVSALRVDPVEQNGNEISVRLWFDEAALHPSIFSEAPGFVPILIDSGWHVESGWHKDIPHFGFQAGAHFIESAVQEFNSSNPYKLKVEVSMSV